MIRCGLCCMLEWLMAKSRLFRSNQVRDRAMCELWLPANSVPHVDHFEMNTTNYILYSFYAIGQTLGGDRRLSHSIVSLYRLTLSSPLNFKQRSYRCKRSDCCNPIATHFCTLPTDLRQTSLMAPVCSGSPN